jgi:hypothetical protein
MISRFFVTDGLVAGTSLVGSSYLFSTAKKLHDADTQVMWSTRMLQGNYLVSIILIDAR